MLGIATIATIATIWRADCRSSLKDDGQPQHTKHQFDKKGPTPTRCVHG